MIKHKQYDPIAPAGEQSQGLHLNFLDGVRALAALFVVFHHIWQGPFGRVARVGVIGALTNWALYGHLAVDVFIVVSGFCLVLPVTKNSCIKGGAVNFFKRRVHRILPPLYFALLLSLIVNFAVHKIGHHPLITGKAIIANIFLLQDWLPGLNNLDGPLWSVAAEWKIYFLFPFLIWTWKRFNAIWMLVVSAIIGYSLTFIYHSLNPHVSMVNTCPWYIFLFAIGICAGICAAPGDSQLKISSLTLRTALIFFFVVLSYLLIKYPITPQGEDELYGPHLPIIDPVAGIFSAAILILLNQKLIHKQKFWLLQLLSWKPLVFIGSFSYSIYLIHIPLIGLAAGGLHRVKYLNSPILLPAFSFLVIFPALILIAYGFYILFERPFLNHRNQFKPLIGIANIPFAASPYKNVEAEQ